jgi:hypothetical protein
VAADNREAGTLLSVARQTVVPAEQQRLSIRCARLARRRRRDGERQRPARIANRRPFFKAMASVEADDAAPSPLPPLWQRTAPRP